MQSRLSLMYRLVRDLSVRRRLRPRPLDDDVGAAAAELARWVAGFHAETEY
ncbi:ORFL125C [Human betaherpesvirus 5]|nr:ORFL125C [Human betaherpesvirus 5]QHX40446.1 ORFL125C [Human betaherpesvirus 5]